MPTPKIRSKQQRAVIPGLRTKCAAKKHHECYSLHCICPCHLVKNVLENIEFKSRCQNVPLEVRQEVSPLKDIINISSDVVDASQDVLRDGRQIGTARSVKGTIGELHVAAWLLQHGYEPYFPAPGRNAKDDMLAVHIATGKVCRVQVKATEGEGDIPIGFNKGQILAKVFLFYAPSDDGGAA